MIKIENVEVIGFDHAIRGMRNPKNSWDKSDSELVLESWHDTSGGKFKIGPNDRDLMLRLAKGGPVHAKYRRMVVVYMDITAPLYWWKEFDTYRVGVVPNPTDIEMNSCSTMHKIQDKEFTLDDFSHEHLDDYSLSVLTLTLDALNFFRNLFVGNTGVDIYHAYTDVQIKDIWWQMIQLLPTSYNQKRTLMMNYEVLADIYRSGRKNHKLDEWRNFCKMIESLPCSEIITCDSQDEYKTPNEIRIKAGFPPITDVNLLAHDKEGN